VYSMKQRSIAGRVLTSGFWGVSRHVNYLGEILQAVALAMLSGCYGHSRLLWIAWLYPLYYILL